MFETPLQQENLENKDVKAVIGIKETNSVSLKVICFIDFLNILF